MSKYEIFTIIINFLSLLSVFIGGIFALWQWKKSLIFKRTEIVKSLIESTRQDKNVSNIMDIIDWNNDLIYDGKFHIIKNNNEFFNNLSDDTLFKMIDHTLSIFSYICYLRSVNTISKKDIDFFEYEIHRLIDNKHIINYLYSIYHWSNKLQVKTSFIYLIEYCIKKKYIDTDFKIYTKNNPKYTCFLKL